MGSSLNPKILTRLRAGTATATELAQLTGASQSTVTRALRALIDDGQLMLTGRARAARYGYRRAVEPIGSHWPLRRIDADGAVHELGILYALASDEYSLYIYGGAQEQGFAFAGLNHGLPYFLQDPRPGGFLGAAVPARYPELDLPQRVNDWNDDQYLKYLTLHGADPVSDLILGDRAFDEYLTGVSHRVRLPRAERAQRYPILADEAMRGSPTGSSVHGEHPKFTVLLEEGDPKQALSSREAIVKFSPVLQRAVGRRWGDLLIAEHHAHAVLNAANVASCSSEVIEAGERIFLEVRRFDRRGAEGRIGVTSLLAIANGLIGSSTNWLDVATRLHLAKRIDDATLETVRLVATFGALIGNTDQHLGNLACFDRYDGRFTLAPIYDMLPMLFAPSHDEIIDREFKPPEPTSATLRAWGSARELAETYWLRLTEDQRISAPFRDICASCHGTLSAQPRDGAYAFKATPAVRMT